MPGLTHTDLRATIGKTTHNAMHVLVSKQLDHRTGVSFARISELIGRYYCVTKLLVLHDVAIKRYFATVTRSFVNTALAKLPATSNSLGPDRITSPLFPILELAPTSTRLRA